MFGFVIGLVAYWLLKSIDSYPVEILISLALGHWVSPYWYLFTAFVGVNLLQSAFTRWCPAMTIFRKLGLKEG